MNTKDEIIELLNKVKDGKISPQKALLHMQTAPFENLGYANIDYHRGLRKGVNEVIFGLNKTKEQIFGIVQDMLKKGLTDILITRIKSDAAQFLKNKKIDIKHYPIANLAVVKPNKNRKLIGNIVIVSAGSSDIPVCEEAALTAEILGNKVYRLYDVGVSGLHRILSQQEILLQARVIIVAAGMEAALAGVIGGLVSCPVIAVPTSVGYGASFNGVAALLGMLNSCASGISVVNIDNGFGAGYIANMINKMESVN
ncbi:MAG: nickel pincer cofactor biosynthesis protein LarB [Elusimicrobiota bacterium]|nr:nickel pincer cofactor biosynthesis protein LarB [Elusimicrobiota bacterium]